MCGQRAEGQGQKPSHSAGTCIKGQGRVAGVSLPWPQLQQLRGCGRGPWLKCTKSSDAGHCGMRPVCLFPGVWGSWREVREWGRGPFLRSPVIALRSGCNITAHVFSSGVTGATVAGTWHRGDSSRCRWESGTPWLRAQAELSRRRESVTPL